MTLTAYPFKQNLSTLIDCANSTLKLTADEIKEKFPDHRVNHFDYIRKNKFEELLEIRFNKESATLTCEFDKLGYCITIYIFTDSYLERAECKSCFNGMYKHNWFKRNWKTSNSYLSITAIEGIVCLKCYK